MTVTDETHAPAPVGGESTGVTPELLERLRPYLAESLMVLDHDWTVKANLAPPGGLIGRGLGLGVHTLEDMHPDDAVQVLELGAEAFATAPGWSGSKVVRMRTGDGRYGRYEITATNRFDDPVIDGMVVRTRPVLHEGDEGLSDLRPASAIEMLAELLPLGVLLLDAQGRVVFANDHACAMLRREPEDLKREGFTGQIDPADQPLVADIVRRILAGPGHESCTARFLGALASQVGCRFASEGLPGGEGIASVVVTLEDVTARHAAQRELEERANTDPLTGLRNRAALIDVLQARIDRDDTSTVAFVDLDGFKVVNDTWGHERGDHLLVAVARALRSHLGTHTEIARLGGDEFVVVASRSEGDAESLAHHLRGVVASVARAEDVRITCSVGLAATRADDTPTDVLRRADEAMYAAKAKARHTA